jgi:hypothetical protein
MTDSVTSLKLIGFSVEVKGGPVELLMQTDKGALSVQISEDQLSKLIYALRFVQYAEEPLRKKRERKHSGPSGLLASVKRTSKRSKRKRLSKITNKQ